jgi:hypothetical protein
LDPDLIARVDELMATGWTVRVRRIGLGIVDGKRVRREARHRWLDEPLERPAETADWAWRAVIEAAEAQQRGRERRRILQ